MRTQTLMCLPITLLLACSGSSLRMPADARPEDGARTDVMLDAADAQPSSIMDSAIDRQAPDTADAVAPDTQPADGTDGIPADARPGETSDITDAIAFVDATRVDTRDAIVDTTRDMAIEPGQEAPVEGDPGLPFCTESTTPATVTIEVPSGRIIVGMSYGSSPDDVWVTTLPDHKMARWNGSAWRWVAELADVEILAIAGSGSSDVWLGGTAGALWHWDGTALSHANSKTSLDIQQITVLASGQAFALAGVTERGSTTFDLIRLIGTEWSVVGQPSEPVDMYYQPHALYAPAASEAWVAVYEKVFHYQNGALATMAMPNPSNVWGTAPDNVLFGGGSRWDGEKIVQPLADTFGIIWGTGPNDMWIGSTHWDGQTATSYGSQLDWGPKALRGLSATDVWATTLHGRVVHFDGAQTWNEVIAMPDTSSTHVEGLATGIWQVGADALWIAGPYNQIYLYQGGTLTPIPETVTTPTDDLLGIWASSTQDLWAVGKNGAIIHGDGTVWARVASPTTSTLRAVSGSTSDDV